MNFDPRSWKVFDSVGRFFASLAVVVIVGGFLFGTAWCTCVGFPTGEAGREALENAGYDDIEMGSPAKYKCSEKDIFSNTFTATNPRGSRVEGVVCCGWGAGCIGKACTVRF